MHTVLTIGFRRERDSFSEPNTGTSQSREEVCVDVTEGVVGTTITIEAVFTPGTATGTHTRVTIVTIPYQTLSYSKWSKSEELKIQFILYNAFASVSLVYYTPHTHHTHTHNPPTQRVMEVIIWNQRHNSLSTLRKPPTVSSSPFSTMTSLNLPRI